MEIPIVLWDTPLWDEAVVGAREPADTFRDGRGGRRHGHGRGDGPAIAATVAICLALRRRPGRTKRHAAEPCALERPEQHELHPGDGRCVAVLSVFTRTLETSQCSLKSGESWLTAADTDSQPRTPLARSEAPPRSSTPRVGSR